jgi:hypothetical protein
MTIWKNNDGLLVRFGIDEADLARGGEVKTFGQEIKNVFSVRSTDLLSATNSILGSAVASSDGSLGVLVPKGLRILAAEVVVKTAFTSSGTIGSSTMLLGLIKAVDRTTELDFDGFLTAAFVGSKLDAVGERNFQEVGTTGSGALIGTTLAENGYISVSNSQHATHPYTAGEAIVTIWGYMP